MRDQVIMGSNGLLGVAVPLFRREIQDETVMPGWTVSISKEKPLAYAVDIGTECRVVSAEYLESNVEFIGDL